MAAVPFAETGLRVQGAEAQNLAAPVPNSASGASQGIRDNAQESKLETRQHSAESHQSRTPRRSRPLPSASLPSASDSL